MSLKVLPKLWGKITKAISGMSDAQLYNKVILAGLLAMVPLVIAAVGSLTLAFGSLTVAMGPFRYSHSWSSSFVFSATQRGRLNAGGSR